MKTIKEEAELEAEAESQHTYRRDSQEAFEEIEDQKPPGVASEQKSTKSGIANLDLTPIAAKEVTPTK